VDNGNKIYTVADFNAEVARQHAKFRIAYVLRWLVGWPKIAFLFGRRKAGWYLVRVSANTGHRYTTGPFNTKAQARDLNKVFSGGYFGFSYVILLWQEPRYNSDPGSREYARPWYRVPARGR